MDANLTHGDDTPADWLSETDWKDFKDPIVGTLFPNFFITYFGQVLPHGDISDNEIKAKLVRLRIGYKLWANTPTMLSTNWTTSLVSWRKSEHLHPSKSTSTRLRMPSPFLLLRQMAP
jgi:hypothetical protein